MSILIGIAGLKGSGKTTAAGYFMMHGYKLASFAAPLKHAVATAFDLTWAEVDNPELKDAPLANARWLSDKAVYDICWAIYRATGQDISFHQYVALCEKVRRDGPLMLRTPREILRYVGTDLFRDTVDIDFWVDLFWPSSVEKEVIADVRFENERTTIREHGGKLILIRRPIDGKADQHASENSLGKAEDYDRVIYNTGTIEDLYAILRDVLGD